MPKYIILIVLSCLLVISCKNEETYTILNYEIDLFKNHYLYKLSKDDKIYYAITSKENATGKPTLKKKEIEKGKSYLITVNILKDIPQLEINFRGKKLENYMMEEDDILRDGKLLLEKVYTSKNLYQNYVITD